MKFFGCGAGFNPRRGNTSAFLALGDILVVLDCGETTYEKLYKNFELRGKTVYVVLTHLHSDHVGSLGSLVSYLYCVLGQRPYIVYPSEDICRYLSLVGVEAGFYHYLPQLRLEADGTAPDESTDRAACGAVAEGVNETADGPVAAGLNETVDGTGAAGLNETAGGSEVDELDDAESPSQVAGLGQVAGRSGPRLYFKPVRVQHVDNMVCYGYVIRLGRDVCYYSGDAADIPGEVLAGFLNGEISRIYQDTAAHDAPRPSHMPYRLLAQKIPEALRARVWCMHLDDDEAYVEQLRTMGFNIAQSEFGDEVSDRRLAER